MCSPTRGQHPFGAIDNSPTAELCELSVLRAKSHHTSRRRYYCLYACWRLLCLHVYVCEGSSQEADSVATLTCIHLQRA